MVRVFGQKFKHKRDQKREEEDVTIFVFSKYLKRYFNRERVRETIGNRFFFVSIMSYGVMLYGVMVR